MVVGFVLFAEASPNRVSAQTTEPSTSNAEPTTAAATTPTPEPTTSTTLDLLPPEVPPTRRTAPPAPTAPETTAVATTTTTGAPVAPTNDPSLAPVCASAVGALPVTPRRPCRIIAYYGTPSAPSLGILGRLPRTEMPAALLADAKAWAVADPSTTTRCAFDLIAITAQASKGPAGLYRARMSPAVLGSMIALARANGCITILDLQVGQSSVPVELPYFLPWLALPDVHLALDPEWDMPPGVVPGTQIGSMEAADINAAIDSMTQLVRARSIPPKLVIVHRFRDFMIVNPAAVRATPEVRLLVNMDGFGPPASKLATYARVRLGLAVELTGFKLFTRNDVPMLRPADVLPLKPSPTFINYQ